MRLEQGAAAIRVRESRRSREGARVDAESAWAMAPPIPKAAANRDSEIATALACRAFPTVSIGACVRTRRHQLRTADITCSLPEPRRGSDCCWPPRISGACRSAELTAKDSVITHAKSGRTTTYGKIADRAARTPHPNPEKITIKPPDQWTLMGTERKNLDVPDKVAGKVVYGIDVRVPGMKWAAVKACPVYGGNVKSYNFDAIRQMPGVRSAMQFPIPDPALTRGRIFSGGVAVVADHWHQARTALDRMPIEWDIPPERAAFNTANMREALLASLDQPGRVRVNQGNVDAAFARAAKVVEATYSTPYLPRARMEPGNATVLVTDNRVDVWIGDQSPQEVRFSASKITGIPEQNVYVNLCHLGGGFGRNGNGPQAEQAIMIANAHRGTPIHLLWTREEDFIGTTYRAMGMARLKAAS